MEGEEISQRNGAFLWTLASEVVSVLPADLNEAGAPNYISAWLFRRQGTIADTFGSKVLDSDTESVHWINIQGEQLCQ